MSQTRLSPALISVVAPVFNEEGSVDELVSRIVASCASVATATEVVLVNDGSTDHTLARLVRLSERMPELRVIDLARNFGHMAALAAGLSQARGDVVVVLDGDLQDPPELIPDLVSAWMDGADVVYAVRARRGEPAWFRLGAGAFYWLLQRGTPLKMPRQAGTYGLIDRRVANTLNALPEKTRFFSGLRAWAGGRQVAVAYHREPRRHGRTRVGLHGLIGLASLALTSFSRMPLRLASAAAVLVGMAMLGVGVIVVAFRMTRSLPVPGWAPDAALIGLMGLAQSLVLAAISEYVGVISDEVRSRPVFLIREEYRCGTPQPLPPSTVQVG